MSNEERYDAQKREFGYSMIAGIPFANFSFLMAREKSEKLEVMDYFAGGAEVFYNHVLMDTPAKAIFRENVQRFGFSDIVDMDALSRKGAGQ